MNKERMSFHIGQKVKWVSQAGGHKKEKSGVVVYVADPLSSIRKTATAVADEKFPSHRRMFDGLTLHLGAVFVEVRDGKTDVAQPKLYMPRLSLVQPAE